MATDPATIPGLISAISRAISDPGSALDREPFAQSVHDWQVGAAAKAIAPFLARHDPSIDCDCGPDYPPGTVQRCEYAQLADAVIDAFNPAGDDIAQVAICIGAVTVARDALAGMRCRCTPATVADQEPCSRCEALGQLGGKAVPR